jgi:hypothetical protein
MSRNSTSAKNVGSTHMAPGFLTAGALNRRPKLAAALKAAKKINSPIIVAKLDRLSRDCPFHHSCFVRRILMGSFREFTSLRLARERYGWSTAAARHLVEGRDYRLRLPMRLYVAVAGSQAHSRNLAAARRPLPRSS